MHSNRMRTVALEISGGGGGSLPRVCVPGGVSDYPGGCLQFFVCNVIFITLPYIQTYPTISFSPFIRQKLGKLCEASCVVSKIYNSLV